MQNCLTTSGSYATVHFITEVPGSNHSTTAGQSELVSTPPPIELMTGFNLKPRSLQSAKTGRVCLFTYIIGLHLYHPRITSSFEHLNTPVVYLFIYFSYIPCVIRDKSQCTQCTSTIYTVDINLIHTRPLSTVRQIMPSLGLA